MKGHRLLFVTLLFVLALPPFAFSQDEIAVLNFQGDSGFQHESKPAALSMVEMLGEKNGWDVRSYIRGRAGFVGIHCAGAIWHECGDFQKWYERLIGTRLVAHPHVQDATLVVANQCHHCTAHLPKEWFVNDPQSVASLPSPVNTAVNSSKLAIGT